MGNWRRWAVLLVVVLMVAAACGDDDDNGDGGSAPQDNPELTGEPIKFMVISASGDVSATTSIDLGNVPQAAEIAAAAVEADGGINGRPVEIVSCEDAGDPNQSAACVRQAQAEGVVAMVGNFTTQGDSYMPVAVELGIPSVAPFAISFPELSSDLSFPIIGGSAAAMAGMAAQLADNGFTNINTSYLDIAMGAAAVSLADLGLEPRGLTMGSTTPIPPDTVDYSPQISAALDSGADGIIVALAPGEDRWLSQYAQAGGDVQVAVPSAAFSPQDAEDLAAQAEGVFLTSSFVPVSDEDNPGIQQFLEEVETYGSDLIVDDSSMNAWAGVHFLAQVLEGKPDQTPADVIAAINSAPPVDLGVIAPFTFAEPINPLFGGAISRLVNQTVVYCVVEDGVIVPLDDGEFIDPFVAP